MKHQILFLAANPIGLTARKLDQQAREIQEELQLGGERDRFQFVLRPAAQPLDLLRALRRLKPSIVHFVGHAQADGIYLTDNDGRPMQMTRETMHATFGAAGRSVRVVVLDGCATDDFARALCDFVPVCVGTSPPITDAAARAFSLGFYGALADGESTASACSQGRAAMLLQATGDHEPLLRHRDDVDPWGLILAEGTSPASHAPEFADVIERYRARKSGAFERWDLRAVGPTSMSGRRPTMIMLDDMYVPLRFAPRFESGILDRGAPIQPNDLLCQRGPQVIIGAAGSGKTTWMRWTFRRLLNDSGAIPFFLELRTIAAAWKTTKDATQSIETYLAEELDECGADRPKEVVATLLANTSGPRVVILIDGWDEIGTNGEYLRKRLVELCRTFSHVVVIVSSRPYGETRPAGAEAFETVYIQPLSDNDVRLVASHFYRCAHGDDELGENCDTDDFMAALGVAPNARSLAETVLLLTMMLFLSRKGPLPDRRHALYNACLHNMLFERVALRERDGVVVDSDQWRPEDSEERLIATAELAYRMQSKQHQRVPVTFDWSNAIDALRADWPRDKRERFLRWLLASTSILTDRTDGSVQFAHLSFQEYLAAYYLFVIHSKDEYISVARSYMGDPSRWEILRLWAALIGDHEPDKLSPVFEALRAGMHTYWLAGQMFADGTGHLVDFEAWVADLPEHLSNPYSFGEGYAWVWGASRQEGRRKKIAAILRSAHKDLRWLDGAWYARWCELARLEINLSPALLALQYPVDSSAAVARSRLLHGAMAGWPDGSELAMLRLWPSTRVAIGVRLQTAITLGAKVRELTDMLPQLLAWVEQSQKENPTRIRFLAREFSYHLRNAMKRRLRDKFDRDSIQSFSHDFACDLARCFVRDLGFRFSRDTGEVLVGEFTRYFGHNFWGLHLGADYIPNLSKRLLRWHFLHNFNQLPRHDLDHEFINRLSPPDGKSSPRWLSAFLSLETRAVAGRASPRATLAHGHLYGKVPLLVLFQAACRASFAPNNMKLRSAAAQACDTFEGDPLWPALARHVTRMSTTMDRALLEDLARHPQKRERPLSWGLQHYVRGDLVLDDDAVITLDALCAQVGLAPLPLLEDVPDELDI
jgi:hypothetical protein